jgi:hypothetical protein
MVLLTGHDYPCAQNLRKLGLPLVPLRIGLVEYKEVIDSQRVALIKENGTCKQLLE